MWRLEGPFETAIGEDEYTDVVLHLRAEPGAAFRGVGTLILEGALQSGPIHETSPRGCAWGKLVEVEAPVGLSSAHRVRLPRAANRFRISRAPGDGIIQIDSLIALAREQPAGAAPIVRRSLTITRIDTASMVISDGTTTATLPPSAVSPGLPPDLATVLHPADGRSLHLTAAGEIRIESPQGMRSMHLAQSLHGLSQGNELDAWTLGPGLWTLLAQHPASTLLAHARHDGLEAAAVLLQDGSIRIRRGVGGHEVVVASVDELAAVVADFPAVPAAGRLGYGYTLRAQIVNHLRGPLAPGSRAERELLRFLSVEVVTPFRRVAGSSGVSDGDRVQLCWDGQNRGAPHGIVITLRQPTSVLVAVQHQRVIQSGGEFEIPLSMLPPGQVARAGMVLGLWRAPR